MRRLLWAQFCIGVFVLAIPALLGVPANAVLFWGNVFSGVAIMLVSLWLIYGEL